MMDYATGVLGLYRSIYIKTRLDTRLPQSRAGGQGPYLRSLDHLGWSCEAKDRKNPKKLCETDGLMDQWMDEQTDKAGCRVA